MKAKGKQREAASCNYQPDCDRRFDRHLPTVNRARESALGMSVECEVTIGQVECRLTSMVPSHCHECAETQARLARARAARARSVATAEKFPIRRASACLDRMPKTRRAKRHIRQAPQPVAPDDRRGRVELQAMRYASHPSQDGVGDPNDAVRHRGIADRRADAPRDVDDYGDTRRTKACICANSQMRLVEAVTGASSLKVSGSA